MTKTTTVSVLRHLAKMIESRKVKLLTATEGSEGNGPPKRFLLIEFTNTTR